MSDTRQQPWLFSAGEKCQNCVEDELAIVYCHDCKRQLCDVCLQHHMRQVDTKNHDIVESPEAEEIRKKRQCPKHTGKRLNCYCNTCSLPKCDDCFKTSCREHDIIVEQDVKEDICTHLSEAKKKQKQFENHMEHISSVSQQNIDKVTLCEEDIDKTFDQLIEKLEEQRKLLHERLQQESEKDQENATKHSEFVQEKLEKLKESIDNAEKLIQSPNVAKIMVQRDSTKEDLGAVAQYGWDPSDVAPQDWQLQSKLSDEVASGFGKLMPKPSRKDIIVEGLDAPLRVGFTNEFTITVKPACQYEHYDVTSDISIKITQKPFAKRGRSRDETVLSIDNIHKVKRSANTWHVSYFLRKHGEISISVAVCGVPAAKPFQLRTVEKREIAVGMKVVRGPDWKSEYGNQDGGDGCVGEVVEVKKDGWVNVKWEKQKKTHDYRWGAGDAYDLKVFT